VTDRAQMRRVIECAAHGRDATHSHPFGRAGLDVLDASPAPPHAAAPVEATLMESAPSSAASSDAVPLDAALRGSIPWNAASMDAVPSRCRPVYAGSDPAGTPEGAVNVHRNH
jgi:hypothetical protein